MCSCFFNSAYFCFIKMHEVDMSSCLYIFNPDTDLALGNNSPHYQPPVLIKKMSDDLSVLPAWYVGGSGDGVWVNDCKKVQCWSDNLPLSLDVCWVSSQTLLHGIGEIIPWGWNKSLLKKLNMSGLSSSGLPTEDEVDVIRRLSSRETAVLLLKALNCYPETCGYSCICHTMDEVETSLKEPIEDGDILKRKLLKSPWSGSGKGLKWANNESEQILKNWCRRILDAQQAVIVEPEYNKVEDFAMEFYADGKGSVSFIGFSLFSTSADGSYKCNYLMSDDDILVHLTYYVSCDVLEMIKCELQKMLSSVLRNDYKGFLGVDMMICRFSSQPFFRLHPCVEVNLRMNMGILSHYLYKNRIAPGCTGIFQIDYFKDSDELIRVHNNDMTAFPLLVEDGRVKNGYLALNPIEEGTRFRSYIRVAFNE